MPLSGKESQLSSQLQSLITANITAATGQPMAKSDYLKAFCDGIAEAVIPFFVANTQVNAGQTVTGTDSLGGPINGSTSTPGTIS